MTTVTRITNECEEKLNQAFGQIRDFESAVHSALVSIGDRFGLYDAMSAAGPATPGDLAQRTGISEQYLRLWLEAKATEGYLDYDQAKDSYCLWSTWPRSY